MAIISMLPLICLLASPKPIAGIEFYITKGGSRTQEFKIGESVELRALSPASVSYDIEVLLIYPAGTGRSPLVILSRRTFNFLAGSEVLVCTHTLAEGDFSGTYALRIFIYNPGGALIQSGDLVFKVSRLIIAPEIIAAILILGVGIGGSVLMLVRRRRPRPTEIMRPSLMPPTAAEGTIRVVSPGTIEVQSYGETLRLVAMFEGPGGKLIPISEIPQNFGREDFVGLVPENILRTISRKGKPHFTVYYDFASGNFLIKDDNSLNGTLLNGEEIRGRGPQPLKNGDIVSPAGAVQLRFATRRAG